MCLKLVMINIFIVVFLYFGMIDELEFINIFDLVIEIKFINS